ncbi:MAG TPA: hypothetical protein VG621_02000 [Candidatus Paceibacterota bacterium]|nr:hypothetical protein [Candidatus Paceibacterota bacterium]
MYVLYSPSDEKVFDDIRLLYRTKTTRKVENCVSQRWFEEISDQTLHYAQYRKFLQVAISQDRLVGFALLFSSIIEIFEKDSAHVFEKARNFLFEQGYDFSTCFFLYHVVDEQYQEVFGGLVLNLINHARAKSILSLPHRVRSELGSYISHIIVLQHENVELHFQLISYKFRLIGSIPMGRGRLPINVFAFSTA